MKRLIVTSALALMFVVPAPSTAARESGLTSDQVAFWDRIAACETGSLWDWGKYAGTRWQRKNEGTLFEGGVGFAASTWRAWAAAVGVLGRYAHAWAAPRLVQMQVAQYGLGLGGYWGCNR